MNLKWKTPHPQYFICKPNPQRLTVPGCNLLMYCHLRSAYIYWQFQDHVMFFTPFSKQAPGSNPDSCQQIYMKPINITWRFQTADNKNCYLTRNRINSSSTKPQKTNTHMHLNVILPHALQTAKFYYIFNSFVLAPIPTSPKCPYQPDHPQVITTMSPVTCKYHKLTR